LGTLYHLSTPLIVDKLIAVCKIQDWSSFWRDVDVHPYPHHLEHYICILARSGQEVAFDYLIDLYNQNADVADEYKQLIFEQLFLYQYAKAEQYLLFADTSIGIGSTYEKLWFMLKKYKK
jgi:hypothetical protein